MNEFGDYRTVRFAPEHKQSLRKGLLGWDGKRVLVEAWHENYSMREMFPNDERVGWVPEMSCDLPESELIYAK